MNKDNRRLRLGLLGCGPISQAAPPVVPLLVALLSGFRSEGSGRSGSTDERRAHGRAHNG
jgi:hypothetical protein